MKRATTLFCVASLLVSAVSQVGAAPVPRSTPLEVKVLVLNYDPIIEAEGNKRLHQVLGWQNPTVLAAGYKADVEASAKGSVVFNVVEWRDLDEFPEKIDGFQYTDFTFLDAWRNTRNFHSPDTVDYVKAMNNQGVPALINSGAVDEVWMFGAPYFGYWESAMAGPGAFFINGGVYTNVATNKPFAIMGYNYERGVAEMIHNLSHRAENHFRRVYGSWNKYPFQHLWDQFSAYDKTSPGHAGVGNCHFPPNADSDYDYGNTKFVTSSAIDWRSYPNLTGATTLVNRETWGGPDYHRNYLKWWFAHLPNVDGRAADRRQHNWWKYIYDFTNYTALGLPLCAELSGTITLGSYVGDVTSPAVTIEIRSPGSTTALETHQVQLDTTGRYSIYTSLTGPRDIAVKATHWLRSVVSSATLQNTVNTARNFTLINGDVDGDNVVTVFDYALLSDAFDTTPTDPAWDARADLDGDGEVSVFDYSILSDSFDKSGDE